MPVIATLTGDRFGGSWLEPLDGMVERVLQDGAQWAMAADVYDTVIVNARTAADAHAIPSGDRGPLDH